MIWQNYPEEESFENKYRRLKYEYGVLEHKYEETVKDIERIRNLITAKLKAKKSNTLFVSSDFSTTPGPRYDSEGSYSGELFREEALVPYLKSAIESQQSFIVDLDGTAGYGTSFIDEAFGGLIRENNFKYEDISKFILLKSDEEPYLKEDIKSYLKSASNTQTIYIDIDDTICHSTEDYTKATPIYENIKKANKLYEDGHEVIYWTARGTLTGINWENFTKNQLDNWGVKYTEIKFGKPFYDIFIDDKNMNTKDW